MINSKVGGCRGQWAHIDSALCAPAHARLSFPSGEKGQSGVCQGCAADTEQEAIIPPPGIAQSGHRRTSNPEGGGAASFRRARSGAAAARGLASLRPRLRRALAPRLRPRAQLRCAHGHTHAVGRGGEWLRRAVSARLHAALPASAALATGAARPGGIVHTQDALQMGAWATQISIRGIQSHPISSQPKRLAGSFNNRRQQRQQPQQQHPSLIESCRAAQACTGRSARARTLVWVAQSRQMRCYRRPPRAAWVRHSGEGAGFAPAAAQIELQPHARSKGEGRPRRPGAPRRCAAPSAGERALPPRGPERRPPPSPPAQSPPCGCAAHALASLPSACPVAGGGAAAWNRGARGAPRSRARREGAAQLLPSPARLSARPQRCARARSAIISRIAAVSVHADCCAHAGGVGAFYRAAKARLRLSPISVGPPPFLFIRRLRRRLPQWPAGFPACPLPASPHICPPPPPLCL